MKSAYVDSSVLAGIMLDEPAARRLKRSLGRLDTLYSSNLLEAELRSAGTREKIPDEALIAMFGSVHWIHPDRPLTAEFGRVLAAGYLRGADLWHVACALYLCSTQELIPFVTLDDAQKAVAQRLGFATKLKGSKR